MSQPTILLGVVLSMLYGSVFHFLRGGSSRRLLADLLLALAGFWAGDSLGYALGWTFWAIGVLNVGMGSVVSLALLVIVDTVSRIQLPKPDEENEQ